MVSDGVRAPFFKGKVFSLLVPFLWFFLFGGFLSITLFSCGTFEEKQTSENVNITYIGWIAGTIKNAIDSQPIKNAKVEIYKRIIDKLPDGTPILGGIEESIFLASVETDEVGQFRVAVPIRQGDINMFQVVVKAEGFNEAMESMVQVNPGDQINLNFELIPDFESANVQDAEPFLSLLLNRQERIKLKMYEENPSFHQEIIPEEFPQEEFPHISLKSTSYSVPDYVKVCNLNGYTGMMNLDDFIAGVVSAEMGDAFPYSALKAQAVASRSYALRRYQATGCANGGQAYTSQIGSKSRNAVRNTSKIVLLYSGNVIYAYFAARCHGDYTLNSEHGVWHSRGICSVGGSYIPYARSRPCSGHINCSQVSGETPCCYVYTGGRWVYIYGHGVGMCQRGAEQFARRDCKTWDSILLGFFTNVQIANSWNFAVNMRVRATNNINVRQSPCGSIVGSISAGANGTIIEGPQMRSCFSDCWVWWKVRWDNGLVGWVTEAYLNRL
jgi:hypothetical protein